MALRPGPAGVGGGYDERIMSTEPIRYAVLALGRAGWNIHVKALRNRPDARIVAVADPQEDRRKQAENELGCKGYPDLGKMLKQEDIEVVVVATPSAAHGPDTLRSLRAGRHVVVEKPMALTLTEADNMIRAAEKAQRMLFVHQNYRTHGDYRFLKETIDSGVLGRVYHIRRYQSNFQRRFDWQTLAKNGGGLLNNHGVHMLDQIIHLLGSPVTQVWGDLQQIASAGDVEDHVKVLLRTESGCTADLEVSTAQKIDPPLPAWIVCGSLGTLVVRDKTARILSLNPADLAPLEAEDRPAPDRKYYAQTELPWNDRSLPVESADKSDFYDSVTATLRHGAPMLITPQSVRELMRVLALARKGTAFPGRVRPNRPSTTPVAVAAEKSL